MDERLQELSQRMDGLRVETAGGRETGKIGAEAFDQEGVVRRWVKQKACGSGAAVLGGSGGSEIG